MRVVGEGLFLAGSVLVPLIFGLIPGFLPTRSNPAIRWILWLAILGSAAWYGNAMAEAPAAYRMLAWSTIAISAALSLIVLVVEVGRPRRLDDPA